MTIKLEVTEQMLGVISRALGAAPFDVVFETITELQRQVRSQRSVNNPAINGGITPQAVKTPDIQKET